MAEDSKNRVLVVGATGMLGARIARYLSKKGFLVSVTGGRIKGNFEISKQWPHVSIEKLESGAHESSFDVIINCAGPSSSWAEKNPGSFDKFVCDHARVLKNLAVRYETGQIINFSTVHVYGLQNTELISESAPHLNSHPYAAGHSRLEKLLLEDLPVSNLRLSNSFGVSEGISPTYWNLFTHDIVRQMVHTGEAVIESNPHTGRDFVPLSLVERGVEAVIENSALGDYNLVSSTTTTLQDWAHFVAKEGEKALSETYKVVSPVKSESVSHSVYSSELLLALHSGLIEDPATEIESLFKFVKKVSANE